MSLRILLDARDVTRVHAPPGRPPIRALDGVTLAITTGSTTVLTGPSGSGKTTLLSLLGALDFPSSGTVLFDGTPLEAASDVALARIRRRIGFVFQAPVMIPGLPLWENLTAALVPGGVPRAERHARALAPLGRLGLGDRALSLPEELSGGELQRASLARALLGEPEVLLADEPTSNLDEVTGRIVRDLLGELREQGRTLVLASHDPQLLPLADRHVRLEAGRILT